MRRACAAIAAALASICLVGCEAQSHHSAPSADVVSLGGTAWCLIEVAHGASDVTVPGSYQVGLLFGDHAGYQADDSVNALSATYSASGSTLYVTPAGSTFAGPPQDPDPARRAVLGGVGSLVYVYEHGASLPDIRVGVSRHGDRLNLTTQTGYHLTYALAASQRPVDGVNLTSCAGETAR